MSLLDDLKKQAALKEARQSFEGSKSQQRIERNWHRLSPKMYLIHDYLKQLVENLNVVLPQDPCEFQLTESVRLRGLVRQKYRVVKNDADSLRSFDFRYDLVSLKVHQATLDSGHEIEKMRGVLKTLPLTTYSESTIHGNRVIFSIEPKITVRFNYVADLEKCDVVLNIDQCGGLWVQSIRYYPDQITEELMDEIGKFALGQPHRMKELSGSLISEAEREALRAELNRKKDESEKLSPNTDAKSGREITGSRLFGLLKK